jgi:mevalonate kinase
MKFVIVLLALVVASQAAFTSSISQQAKPIIQDAVIKMHAVAKTSNLRENDLINAIINGIQLQTEHVIAQVENALNAGQQIAAGIVDQIQSTVQNLQTIGAQAAETATSVVNNLLNNIHGLFNGLFNGRAEGGILTQTIADLINQFNFEHHVSNALTNPITQLAVQWVTQILNTLGFTPVVETAVAAVLGQDLAEWIFGHFNQRGLFDGFAGLAGQISAATQQVIASVQSTLQQFAAVATQNFVQLQELVAQTLQQVTTLAHENLVEACNELLATLKPFQQQLGGLYQQTVDQINALLGKN